MGARGVLRILEGDRVAFFCPGCRTWHHVSIPPHQPAWGFNGDYDRPTFTPSILVQGFITDEAEDNEVCHSFVTGGRIQFLADSTHALAGQTVDLVLPLEE